MPQATHVPGLGKFSKKELYIGGSLAGVVVLLAIYRSHKNSQAAATAATTTTSTATDTSGTDPTTGYASGSPEDVAALEAQSSYANATDYGYASGSDYGTGTGTVLTGVTSNAEWAQAAETYLTQNAGADAATVSAALGAYLTGSYVTPSQQQIVEQSIAFEGYPPQSGGSGYPPAMKTVPPSTTTGGTTKTPTPGKSLPPPGTVIKVPVEVKPGNTPADIARHFGIAEAHLLEANPGKSANSPNGTVFIVPYEIKAGMTLQSVASAFGIAIEHLQEYLP